MKTEPKIVHVVWSPGVGGIIRVVMDLAQHQAGMSQPNRVGLLLGQGDDENLEQKCRQSGIQVHKMHIASGLSYSKKMIAKVADIFRLYDIVHYHGFNPALFAAGVMSSRNIVYSFHGPGGGMRKKQLNQFLKKKWFERLFNANVRIGTANSNFTLEMLRKHYSIDSLIIRTVHNGIDIMSITSCDPTKLENYRKELKFEDAFVVGSMGRLVDFKRVHLLVKAFAAFHRSSLDANAKLLIVGDGPERARLERLVAKYGLESVTVFAGFRRDVSNWYGLMDIFSMTSIGEPFGLVVAEAMVHGKIPVALEDCGGAREIIEKNDSGFVVQNPDKMAGVFKQLCEDKDLRDKLSAKCMSTVRQNFTIDAMADAMEQVYVDAMKA